MSFNFTNKVRKNENILIHLFIWRKIYNTVLFVIIIYRGDQDNLADGLSWCFTAMHWCCLDNY